MSGMFYYCYNLTSLDLSSIDFSKVESFSRMFEVCGSSASMRPIPIIVTQEGYDILKDKDTGINPSYASFCISNPKAGFLTNVAVFNSALRQFQSQNSLRKIKFIAGSKAIGTPILGSDAVMVANGDCLEIHTSASEFVFNEDCSSMFSNLDYVTEIDFNDCINTSSATDMSGMFYYCRYLTSLDLSSFDASNVTDMSDMFDYCSSLTSLDLSSFDTSNVTDMRNMFLDCRSLTSLDLSNFDFSKVESFSRMFLSLGSMAPNKPISISVTQAGYDILNAQSTGINDSYAKLVVVP
jgi:surface protein